MLSSHKVIVLVATLAVIISLARLTLSLACVDDDKCKNNTNYGEFSVCENELCRCVDFYGSLPTIGCTKAVAYGSPCRLPGECKITLGESSTCNTATRICDCYDLTGNASFLDGRCYKVKALGEACTEDGQCILGSNDLGRCVNQTCNCYTNDVLTLVPGDTGFCQLETPADCPSSDGGGNGISVFAATAAGSAALLVVVVLIYQATRPKQLKAIGTPKKTSQAQNGP